MTTVVKRDVKKFMKEIKHYYDDVWKLPQSPYLKKPDFVVVDPRTGKKVKVSFVSMDDGEVVSVVYDELS